MTTGVQHTTDAHTQPVRVSTYARRMSIYFREMYPPATRLATSTLLYVSFTLLVLFVQKQAPVFAWPWILLGSVGGFLFALILRLMDELKDARIDGSIFPKRPVPSGRVRLADIRITLVAACTLFLAIHVTAGMALYSAAALLIYAFLMYRYFYLPERLKAKLLVNLATHNPVVPLLLLHFVVLSAVQYGIPSSQLKVELVPVVGMYWALLLAWELARKVRYPEEESDYQTYSRIFGSVGAAALSFSVQSLALSIGIYLVFAGTLSVVCLPILLAAYAWLIGGYARFLLRKVASGTSLRGTAELYSALVMSAAPVEFIFQTVKSHVLS